MADGWHQSQMGGENSPDELGIEMGWWLKTKGKDEHDT